MNWNLGALCISVILNTAGGLIIKQSAKMEDKLHFAVLFLISGFSFFIALLFYSYALRKISLTFAQPFVAGFGLLNIALFSWLFFGEKISSYGVVGVVFILVGIMFLTL